MGRVDNVQAPLPQQQIVSNNGPHQQPHYANNAQAVNGVYVENHQMPQQVHNVNSSPVTGIPQGSPIQVNVGTVASQAWTTGLFDCMDDPTTALVTAMFPCVTFGQIADVLDNGHTTCATSGIVYAAAPCLVSRPYRKKLRQRFGLVEAPSSDWIVHSIFEPCALCQEYRELYNRGIDPALGYLGNVKKQAIQKNPTTMVPPANQMMMN